MHRVSGDHHEGDHKKSLNPNPFLSTSLIFLFVHGASRFSRACILICIWIRVGLLNQGAAIQVHHFRHIPFFQCSPFFPAHLVLRTQSNHFCIPFLAPPDSFVLDLYLSLSITGSCPEVSCCELCAGICCLMWIRINYVSPNMYWNPVTLASHVITNLINLAGMF